jgi:hypothetical protein
VNVVCVASYFKGADFLRECREQGARVSSDYARAYGARVVARRGSRRHLLLPDDAGAELVIHAAAHLSRETVIHALVALEEFDVVTVALAREHLRLPGMDSSRARRFRDKLAMRVRARDAGMRVPDFVPALQLSVDRRVHGSRRAAVGRQAALGRVLVGYTKVRDGRRGLARDEALDAREALQDRSSYYLLEKFVAGEVFHVDSVVEDGRVIFHGASRYGRPPMSVAQEGGVFTTHTLEYDSAEHAELTRLNEELLRALGLECGAAHAEFIRGAEDGEFYFLEVAARVGGAHIAETLEAASGHNLWREWARVEVAHARGESVGTIDAAARVRRHRALARAAGTPGHVPYDDPEIVFRMDKPYHVGLVVRSPELARVRELLDSYAERFARDFSAYVPPPERRGINL